MLLVFFEYCDLRVDPRNLFWVTVFPLHCLMGQGWPCIITAVSVILPLRCVLSLTPTPPPWSSISSFSLLPHGWTSLSQGCSLGKAWFVCCLLSHGAQGQRGSLAAVVVVFTTLATSGCCWHCGLESLARHLLGLGAPTPWHELVCGQARTVALSFPK